MRVHYDEGLASHIGPESCADTREGVSEALTGVRTGQPLSRERTLPGADSVKNAEGNTARGVSVSASSARRGRRPWHVRTLLVREPGDLQLDPPGGFPWVVRIGKARSRSR